MTPLERYGPPGARPGEQGRVYSRLAGYSPELSLRETLVAVQELIGQGTLDALARAAELATRISDRILLPQGTWCMVGRYPTDPPGAWRVWSAHYAEEEARAWARVYNNWFMGLEVLNHWGEGHRFRAERRDDAQAHHLRRAGADPAKSLR